MSANGATGSRGGETADKQPNGKSLALLGAELQRPIAQHVRRAFSRIEALVFACPGYAATLVGRRRFARKQASAA